MPARPAVVGVRVAEDLDEAVVEVRLPVRDRALEVLEAVLLPAQQLRALVGVVEDRDGVLQRLGRAAVDLLEVRLAHGDERGVDVEGHGVLGDAERVEAGVGLVDHRLDRVELRRDLVEVDDGGAVDLCDPFRGAERDLEEDVPGHHGRRREADPRRVQPLVLVVQFLDGGRGDHERLADIRVDGHHENAVVVVRTQQVPRLPGPHEALVLHRRLRDRRQQGVADCPVDVGPLAGAAGPLREPPGAAPVGVAVALPLALRVLVVAVAVGEAHDVRPGPRPGGRRRGERALVAVVDVYRRLGDEDRLGLRLPVVLAPGVGDEVVPLLQGRGVVAPGVPVPLGEERLGVELVDLAVGLARSRGVSDVLDVVGLPVGDLALADREVPGEAVVERAGSPALARPRRSVSSSSSSVSAWFWNANIDGAIDPYWPSFVPKPTVGSALSA